MMRFTILVFLAASVGLGRKEQPLWMRCIVLAVRAGWFLRESRNLVNTTLFSSVVVVNTRALQVNCPPHQELLFSKKFRFSMTMNTSMTPVKVITLKTYMTPVWIRTRPEFRFRMVRYRFWWNLGRYRYI